MKRGQDAEWVELGLIHLKLGQFELNSLIWAIDYLDLDAHNTLSTDDQSVTTVLLSIYITA